MLWAVAPQWQGGPGKVAERASRACFLAAFPSLPFACNSKPLGAPADLRRLASCVQEEPRHRPHSFSCLQPRWSLGWVLRDAAGMLASEWGSLCLPMSESGPGSVAQALQGSWGQSGLLEGQVCAGHVGCWFPPQMPATAGSEAGHWDACGHLGRLLPESESGFLYPRLHTALLAVELVRKPRPHSESSLGSTSPKQALVGFLSW